MSSLGSLAAYGVEKGDMIVLSDGVQPGENGKTISAGGYKVDPFARQAALKTEDYVEFRTMSWVQAGCVATAESIAIGLLSFPTTFKRLGMAGGVLATVLCGVLTYVSAWIMVDFKIRHPGVMNYPDIGDIMFGKWGRNALAFGLAAKSVGVAASHCVVGQVAMQNMTNNNIICGIWWALLLSIVSIMMSPTRSWGSLRHLSLLSLLCILTASLITIVAVARQDPAHLTQGGAPIYWTSAAEDASLVGIVGAITNIIFGFASCGAAMSFASEMRRPEEFKKSFVVVNGTCVVAYTLVGAVIYASGGQYVVSPALTMTSRTVRITAYAIAMVTIMISGILVINVGAKYIYVSTLRDSPLLTSKCWRARLYWLAIVSGLWVLGFLCSQLIPFLNDLLTIVASLFVVWFAFGLVGCQWLYDNHPRFATGSEVRKIDTWGQWCFFAFSIFSILFSLAITPLGVYSAVKNIVTNYRLGNFKPPFTC